MNEELKQGAIAQAHQAAEVITTNPKIAMAVGTGTASVGLDTVLWQTLTPFFGVVATLLGIVLTSVLIYRNLALTIREGREYKLKVKEREEALKNKA